MTKSKNKKSSADKDPAGKENLYPVSNDFLNFNKDSGRYPLPNHKKIQFSVRSLVAPLLPIVMWVFIANYMDREFSHAFTIFLLPVILASWWGGLYAGLGSTIISGLAAWDFATPGTPAFNLTSGRQPGDYFGLAVFIATCLLIVFLQEVLRRRTIQFTIAAFQREENRKSLEARDDIFNQTNDLIQSLDANGKIIYVNRSWCETMGYMREELIGQNIFNYIHPDCRDHCNTAFGRLLQGENIGVIEITFVARDGHIIDLEGNVSARMENGVMVSTRGIFRDITRRKKAEEEQRSYTDRMTKQGITLAGLTRNPDLMGGDLRLAWQSITEATAQTLGVSRVSIWFYDNEHRMLRCDDLFEMHAGTHSRGMTFPFKDFPAYFSALNGERIIAAHDAMTDPRTREFAEIYLKPLGISAMLDATVLKKGAAAGVICCEHTGTPRQWTPDEQTFTASVADLIALSMESFERRQAEEGALAYQKKLEDIKNNLEEEVIERTKIIKARETELARQNAILEERVIKRTEDLKKSNEDLESFAYIASHDLRAPLRAIRNLAGWIQEDLNGSDAYSDEIRDNFKTLHGRISRMEGMISSLLEYSRLNKTGSVPEEIDIKKLIDELADLLNPPKGFKIVMDLEQQKVITHNVPLQRIFLNLLNNVIKHHDRPEEGLVKIHFHREGDMARFTVADNGPGIPEAFLSRAESIFQTLKSRDVSEGAGMGLPIVKRIVELHGGQLHLSNFGEGKGGTGLTVSFTWPIGNP